MSELTIYAGAGEAHGGTSSPLRGGRLALALLCAAQLMLVLDVTVVNVALPDLAREFGTSIATAGWVIIAYGVPFGGLLLMGGRAADAFGTRRVLVAGLLLFTGASLLAGVAPGMPTLLAARALQGVGAALLSPAALASVMERFPGAGRHRALAVWAAVGAVGAGLGVLVGGLLTAGPGWRAIFFVNVPVGLLVLVLLPLAAPARAVRRGVGRIDARGAVLVTATIATLLYGLTAAGAASPGLASAALAAAAVLFALAVASERRAARPLVDWSLLRRPAVRGGGVVMLAATGLMVGGFFLLSFTVQQGLGWSPLKTGIAFLPIALATLVGAHGGGHLVAHAGTRRLAVAAALLAAAGAGLAALVHSPAALVGGMAVSALGLGAGFVAASVAALSGPSADDGGARSGLLNTCHELGGALGVALLSATVLHGAGGVAAPGVAVAGFWALSAAALVAAGLAFVAMPRVRPSADAPRFVH